MSLMRSLFLILCVGGTLLSSSFVRADDVVPRTKQLERDVELLIDDLQSAKRSIRVAAESELKELGPQILPLLPSPETLSNAAARESVRRIRILLEKQHAEELAEASTVTLQGEFTLAEIVAAISEQTANALLVDELAESAREQQLTVDFENTSFWRAWDRLLDKTDLTAEYIADRRALQLTPRQEPPADHPVAYAGPFRIAITSVRRIDQIGEDKPQRLRFNVQLVGEPRLRPLFLKYASADIVLETAEGATIPPATPNAKFDLPWSVGKSGIDLRWDFLIPPDMPASEAELRGQLRIELASGTERFVFDDLAAKSRIAQRRGGVTVGQEKVDIEKQGERSRLGVRISVQYDAGGPAFESHRNWMFHNQALLLPKGDDGRSIRPDDFITERQGDGTFVITYRFDNWSGDVHDYVFEYQAPTLLIMVPVEFLFPQIDIPAPEPEK